MQTELRLLRTVCATALAATLVFCIAVAGELGAEPRSWRGNGSGRFRDAEPPRAWSKNAGIVWKAQLPGGGVSSPVIAEDRLFVAAEPSDVVCLSAVDGSPLWQTQAGYAAVLGKEKADEIEQTHARFDKEQQAARDRYEAVRKSDPNAAELPELKKQVESIDQRKNEYSKQYPSERRGGAGNAAATPVCDGERVFVTFSTGIVGAFGMQGERHWLRRVQVSQVGWGHSASPVIADGKLIVHFQDLIALDPNTGEEVWRAKVPARQGTPAVAQVGEQDVLITPSGALVRARDGRILAEKLFDVPVVSPLVHDGTIYAHEVGKVKAIRLPTSLDDPIEKTPVWEVKSGNDERLASAVWHDGLLYSGTRRGVLEVTDAATGKTVYRKRLPLGELYPSIALAGDLILVSGAEGKTAIVRPGRDYDEVAVNELDRFSTSPIFMGQRMYVRADKHLYCVGR